MNPQTQQQSFPQMTPEEAKAALGNATFLQDQLLHAHGGQNGAQNAPVEQQNAPQQAQQQQPATDLQSMEQRLLSEISEIKSIIEEKPDKEAEIRAIKQEIATLLNE